MLDKCYNLVSLKTNDVQYNSGAVYSFLTVGVNQWHLEDPDCVLSGSADSLLERSHTLGDKNLDSCCLNLFHSRQTGQRWQHMKCVMMMWLLNSDKEECH